MPRRSLPELVAALLLFSLMALLILLRTQFVDRNIGTYIACPGCFDISVLSADLPMVAFMSAALLLAGWLSWRLPGRFLHLAAGLVMVVYVADLVVFRLFSSRLFLSDVALFISEREAVWDQYSTGVGGPVTAIVILFALLALLLLLWFMPASRSRPARLFLAGILLLALGGSLAFKSRPYVNDWATGNVFAANLATTERVHYSEEFEQSFGGEYRPHRVDTGPPPIARGNVVFVLLESWSAWHSRLFGGFDDWTPQLDAAAERGLRFTDFHSIGFSTDKGLVGILAGQALWSPFLHWFETPPFHSMWGVDRSLPRAFLPHGYQAAFLTSGPLTLYRKGEWMSDLGFGHVEGNEHDFYADLTRYAFGSASDGALYQRALQWQASASQPYMLVIETVTTHQPYVDPDSGERSLEKAMRYADREFGSYLRKLEDSGFFDGGLLVVISDHRSMTPVPAEELERFGPGTFSRVPMFIIGPGMEPGSVDQRVLSQGDLVPTFEWWLSGSTELGDHDALLLGSAVSPRKCALHSRGDRRGLMEVICPEGHGQVRLDGDQTRFVRNEGLDAARRNSVLKLIATERLAGLQRQRETETTRQQETP